MNYRQLVAVPLALAVLAATSPAHAFSTRIHIVFSNRLREQLVLSGDGTIPLEMGRYHVQLPQADADAIVAHPLEFRAGAIGPDSFVFVALTDGTHAIRNNPYGQCELLYEDAATEEERAYALGCFVHGSTDAVAHHFVNYFSGETWTNNPVAQGRASSWLNAIRHILMESRIQRAVYAADPSTLDSASLSLQFPDGFVLRNYYDPSSHLWPVLAIQATEKLDVARAAMPGASLYAQIGAAHLAPVEYVELAPLVVADLQTRRADLRGTIEARIAELQDRSSVDGGTLRVGAGHDATLGTNDDTTFCVTSCPELYGEYWVLLRMLQPRMDASGHVLPSAFDKVSDRLGRNLQQFLPALVATIENLVTALNAPITGDGGDPFENVNAARVEVLFRPMTDWVTTTTAIDYDTISRAVAPDWYTRLSDEFRGLGIDISIGNILAMIFQPEIDAIRSAVEDYVIGQARMVLDELIMDVAMYRGSIGTEYDARLAASAPPGLGGDIALEHFFESGLYANGFNLAAATLANHDVMVPPAGTDGVDTGPASFDASYTVTWSQAVLCPYLRDAIFPLGYGVRADLSVRNAAGDFMATNTDDSNVECQDGDLAAWDPTPGPDSCTFVPLDELISSTAHRGSQSRAYPAEDSAMPPGCRSIVVPGLPEPPATPDAGTMPTSDGGTTTHGDAGAPPPSGAGGCGCAAAGDERSGGAGLAFLGIGLALIVLRRRAAMIALAALAVACSDPSPAGSDSAIGTDSSVLDTGTIQHDAHGGPLDTDVPRIDAGNPRRDLIAALGTSTWSATLTRTEGTTSRTRLYEMRFRATDLLWLEVRNPFGPALDRRERSFTVDADGAGIHSIVITPTGWPVPPDNGQRDDWTFEIVPGTPRMLRITDSIGNTEELTEGAVPAPTDGLTAEVRVFAAGGTTDAALCTSGIGSIDRRALWDFARGRSADHVVSYDVVAGAHLRQWRDGGTGRFGVTDIDGFDQNGGTLLSDTGNFMVRYTGVLHGTGASTIWAREINDSLDHWALFVFGGAGVGGTLTSALWLDVIGFTTISDATSDPNSLAVGSGDIPIEVIILRCAGASSEPLDAQLSFDGRSSWVLVGDAASAPAIDTTLFPSGF